MWQDDNETGRFAEAEHFVRETAFSDSMVAYYGIQPKCVRFSPHKNVCTQSAVAEVYQLA